MFTSRPTSSSMNAAPQALDVCRWRPGSGFEALVIFLYRTLDPDFALVRTLPLAGQNGTKILVETKHLEVLAS